MNKKETTLVAPCGINCGDCGVHRQGLDRFLEKRPEIKQGYCPGRMETGRGVQLR